MRLWRVIALFLVLGVGAGPALLDPCLVGCHEPAAQAAVPSCHEVADGVATARTSIASTAGCGHDHSGFEADQPLEMRSAAARPLEHAMVLPEAAASAQPPLGSTPVVLPPSSALHPHTPQHPQLRV